MGRLIAALVVLLLVTAVRAQGPESSFGWSPGRPVGNVAELDPFELGMTGVECGIRIGIGQINAAAHEIQDGSFNLGTIGPDRVTVILPRGAEALWRVKEFDQKDAELRLIVIPQRSLERVR
jgi:hypothetical protein